jgi:hypothetical protein
VWSYASRTCAILYSYVDMGMTSKDAVNLMSKQIRNATAVQSCSTQELVLRVPSRLTTNKATVTYSYTPTNQSIVQTITESGQQTMSKILVTRCTNFAFSVYQRTPISNSFSLYETGYSTNTTKVVQMRWRSTRPLRGDKDVIEDQVSAEVVIRSK